MWLLDGYMDVHLAGVLAGFEFPCDTAGNRGWKDRSKGDLMPAAGFELGVAAIGLDFELG